MLGPAGGSPSCFGFLGLCKILWLSCMICSIRRNSTRRWWEGNGTRVKTFHFCFDFLSGPLHPSGMSEMLIRRVTSRPLHHTKGAQRYQSQTIFSSRVLLFEEGWMRVCRIHCKPAVLRVQRFSLSWWDGSAFHRPLFLFLHQNLVPDVVMQPPAGRPPRKEPVDALFEPHREGTVF